MKTLYLITLLLVSLTTTTNAQSRKEQRRIDFERKKADKEYDERQKQRAIQEALEAKKIAERRLIFDVLNDELFVRISSDLLHSMEKYGYKLKKAQAFHYIKDKGHVKNFDELRSSGVTLDKIKDVYVSRSLSIDFEGDVFLKVGFEYSSNEGDEKTISLACTSEDSVRQHEVMSKLLLLQPLLKYKEIADEVIEEGGIEPIHIDNIDLNKIAWESGLNTYIENIILGKEKTYPWNRLPQSTLLASEVLEGYLKTRIVNKAQYQKILNLTEMGDNITQDNGISRKYISATSFRKGKQNSGLDYAIIGWNSDTAKLGTKHSVFVDGVFRRATGNGNFEELSSTESLYNRLDLGLLDLSTIANQDFMEDIVYSETFSGKPCFRIDSKWHSPSKDNNLGTKYQNSYFFAIDDFRMLGIRDVTANDNFSSHVYETEFSDFKQIGGQLLPHKSIQYNLIGIDYERDHSYRSETRFEYKINTKIDNSKFDLDFSKKYGR